MFSTFSAARGGKKEKCFTILQPFTRVYFIILLQAGTTELNITDIYFRRSYILHKYLLWVTLQTVNYFSSVIAT